MSEKVKTILGKVGLSPKGEWKASNKYERLDVVSYSGASFLSLSDENDALLTDASKWMVIAQKGDKGDTGDYYEFRVSGNKLQLKLNRSEETEWKDLFDISTLNGKTPVLKTVAVANGSTPSGAFTKTGEDASGNPEYKLALTVQAGKDGQPPVFETETETVSSETEASVVVTPKGETPEGNPIYLLSFRIPQGIKGQDGTGSGNVYVEAKGLQAGKKYVFVPGQNDSANGTLTLAESYSKATSSTLGLVMIGYAANEKNYPVTLDSAGKMFVNVPWTDTNTTYSVFKAATASAAGGTGLVPAPAAGAQSKFLRADGTWQTPVNTTYSKATSSALGLVMIGYSENGKNYPVELDSSGKMFVNVPWTDNNTTYNLVGAKDSTGLVKNGSTVTNASGYTACPIVGGIPYYKDTNTTYSVFKAATGDAAGGTGLVPAPAAGAQSKFLRADGTWQVPTNTTYSKATSSTLGLVMIGYAANGKNYPVVLDSTGKMYVNVPWTDNNTTYNLVGAKDSTGLVKNGSTVTNASGYTACPIVGGIPYYKDTNTTYKVVTVSADGLMSKTDKAKLDKIPQLTKNTDSATTVTKQLAPNQFYQFGTVTSLTITLAAETSGIYNEYMFEFKSGSTATKLSLPSDIKWAGGEAPTINSNKTYQVSIVDKLAVIGEF